MTPFFAPASLSAPALAIVSYLVHSLWEGALIVALAAVVMRVFPRSNATTRYAVWYIALLAVVTIPALTVTTMTIAPRLFADRSDGTPVAATARSARTQVATTTAYATPRTITGVAGPADRANVTPVTGRQISPPQLPPLARPQHLSIVVPRTVTLIVAAIWILGALLGLVRIAFGYAALAKLQRDALPLPPGYREAMPLWSASSGKERRATRLCVSPDVAVPVAVGLFDGMILMPDHLLHSFDQADIDRFSVHELAHLQRHDDWTCTVERIACAVLFFNPVMRVISRQLDLEREVACDDWVVTRTREAHPYAVGLAKMAHATPWPHRPIPTPAIFVTRKSLSIRVERLLNKHRDVRPKLAGGAAAACGVALAVTGFVLLPVAPVIGNGIAPAAQIAAQPAPHRHTASHAHVPASVHRSTTSDAGLAATSRRYAATSERYAMTSNRYAAASARYAAASTRPAAAPPVVSPRLAHPGVSPRIAPPAATSRPVGARAPSAFPARAATALIILGEALHKREFEKSRLLAITALGAARAARASAASVAPTIAIGVDAAANHVLLIAAGPKPASAHVDFLDALDAAGYSKLTADQIIALHDSGVSSRLLVAAGRYFNPRATVDEVVALANAGVSGTFLDDLGRRGVKYTPKDVIAFAQGGVSASYLEALLRTSPAFTPAAILELSQHGVSAHLVTGLRERGYDVGPADLIEFADHGISLSYVDRVNAHRGTRLSLKDIIMLHDHGVSGDGS